MKMAELFSLNIYLRRCFKRLKSAAFKIIMKSLYLQKLVEYLSRKINSRTSEDCQKLTNKGTEFSNSTILRLFMTMIFL